MMRFHVLACDYDGTLATDGRVDAATVAALERLRGSGRRLVMVTGRRLVELLEIFPAPELFDWMVVENGAVAYEPSTGSEKLLAEPPPREFVATLTERGVVPIAVGHTVVATWEPHETAVLQTIRDLGLGMQIVMNKGAVMVLPNDVSKATGLQFALKQLGYSPRNAAAAGDAENDHPLLQCCECGAAVANAVSALKSRADVVLERDHGAGVVDLINEMLRDDLATWMKDRERRRLTLTSASANEPLVVPTAGTNLIIDSAQSESLDALVLQVMEQLSAEGYQWCAFSVAPLAPPPSVSELGANHAPSVQELEQALANPQQSVIVNCSHVSAFEKSPFLAAAAERIANVRAAKGRPHWVLWLGLRDALKNAGLAIDGMEASTLIADVIDQNTSTDDPPPQLDGDKVHTARTNTIRIRLHP